MASQPDQVSARTAKLGLWVALPCLGFLFYVALFGDTDPTEMRERERAADDAAICRALDGEPTLSADGRRLDRCDRPNEKF